MMFSRKEDCYPKRGNSLANKYRKKNTYQKGVNNSTIEIYMVFPSLLPCFFSRVFGHLRRTQSLKWHTLKLDGRISFNHIQLLKTSYKLECERKASI